MNRWRAGWSILTLTMVMVQPVPAETAARLSCVKVAGIPHVRQKPDFCGEACVEMVCRKLGWPVNQDQVFNISGLDPALGRGCWTAELKAAVQRLGFEPGPTWYTVRRSQMRAAMERLFGRMHADWQAGIASIVCMKYSFLPDSTEHFRLLVGYDAKADQVIYHEPARDDGAERRMSREDFFKLWPLQGRGDSRLLIWLRMKPVKRPSMPMADDGPFDNAAYAQHVLALKKKLPDVFTVVISRPFVVVGDEPADRVRQRAQRTVGWAVERLKAAYFDEDPDRILDIYLFKDKASYEKHCRQLFGMKPHTPFGFYSDHHGALVMNIATGGGTLVHELVHPFMEANFPACPAWFNEGLGSLYEQCGQGRDGRIVGYTNWRLKGLQSAIAAGRVPDFKTLTGTTADQFYGRNSGIHYAQARYLCYYLQQKGLLGTFYRQFKANAAEDPTGFATLGRVLGVKDWSRFQAEWEKWVKGLSFP